MRGLIGSSGAELQCASPGRCGCPALHFHRRAVSLKPTRASWPPLVYPCRHGRLAKLAVLPGL